MLKSDIVIVNEFSYKDANGKGTRGSSLGRYVSQYMNRDGACDNLTPTRVSNLDTFITKYMLRKDAVDKSVTFDELDKKMDLKYAGLSFGKFNGVSNVSFSDEDVGVISKAIDNAFHNGKTIMKTVLSFKTDYLKKNGIIDESLEVRKRGDFRGQVDQLKLRTAIIHGLKHFGKDYDDLNYIGVIQVDTLNVHCHLCMYDAGEGKWLIDGKQRGKINARSQEKIRRFIDLSLDSTKSVQILSKDITANRHNIKCHVKNFTHKILEQNGLPQFILACLPENEKLWRSESKVAEMQKALRIIREYVIAVLNEDDSGYDEILANIHKYAKTRMEKEGFNEAKYREIVDNGNERLINECIQGVLNTIKLVPKKDRKIKTKMLDIMSNDISNEHLKDDKIAEFSFKLRAYSTRLDYHKKEFQKYRDWFEQVSSSVSSDHPMYKFVEFEKEYHRALLSKYYHFLKFLPDDESYKDNLNELTNLKLKLDRMIKLYNDKDIENFKSSERAKDYAKRVYDLENGDKRYIDKEEYQKDINFIERSYKKKENEFSDLLDVLGLKYTGDLKIEKQTKFKFDDVKWYDLHHLKYDFSSDIKVDPKYINLFRELTYKRLETIEGARNYLVGTDQSEYLDELPINDVKNMYNLAENLNRTQVLENVTLARKEYNRSKTVPLDKEIDIKSEIKRIISNVDGRELV